MFSILREDYIKSSFRKQVMKSDNGGGLPLVQYCSTGNRQRLGSCARTWYNPKAREALPSSAGKMVILSENPGYTYEEIKN